MGKLKLTIKKGDQVTVIAGSEKGKSGEVLSIKTSPLKIQIKDVKLYTKVDKKTGQSQQLPAFIDYSNVKKANQKKA
ncbi:MAG: 50S ribosomal protein L24 [Bdellovibrionales bacterium]|nr:50S ribosomal protein L24 [Bdellovibrionales bacterium]